MFPAPPLTDPDERISRIRFFTRKLRSRNSILMDDRRRRQWVSSEHGSEAGPGQIAVPTAPPEPFLPYPDELVMIPSDPIAISGDAVVGAVPPDHPRQASVLFPERPVQISSAPLGHGSERSSIAVFRRYLPHDVLAPPRPSPHVGKAKEVESRAHGRRMTPIGTFEPEVYEACLGRMELKSIPAKPLAKHAQQSLAGRCRHPCKTRFRLAGSAFAGRASNPLGHKERFQATSILLSRAYPDASWAHVRRGFFEIARKGNAPIATQALLRIAALYRIEETVRGKNAEQRRAVRREQSAPHCYALKRFLEKQLGRVSAKAPIAQAIRYALKHWEGLIRFLDDGRIDLDTNIVERSMRPQVMLESLCIPSSSVCKHWNRVVVSDATRATFSGHRRFDRLRRQVVGANLVWRAGHNLHRGQHAGFDQAA
jgi:hypothetical protein